MDLNIVRQSSAFSGHSFKGSEAADLFIFSYGDPSLSSLLTAKKKGEAEEQFILSLRVGDYIFAHTSVNDKVKFSEGDFTIGELVANGANAQTCRFNNVKPGICN